MDTFDATAPFGQGLKNWPLSKSDESKNKLRAVWRRNPVALPMIALLCQCHQNSYLKCSERRPEAEPDPDPAADTQARRGTRLT